MKISKAIPTNLITGFLGVGKTTAIQYLLAQKPEQERWAVLVNEFGEIGVDANLLNTATDSQDGGLFIREVPGGCMCCAAGLPMQVALNQLISQARPDRLLIEPSGLGHPREVMQSLLQPEYTQIIALRTIVTLVDARKIKEQRYTEHLTFNQQLEVADKIVANKSDLYGPEDFSRLKEYLNQKQFKGRKEVTTVTQGRIQPTWLDEFRHTKTQPSGVGLKQPATSRLFEMTATELGDPEHGMVHAEKQEDGFFYDGWAFSSEYVFDAARVTNLMYGLMVTRLKAIFKTGEHEGVTMNFSDDVLTVLPVAEVLGSRLEIIDTKRLDQAAFEKDMLTCLR
ncbi:MAG: CobW family GTP-binding protein [Thiotrichales bacterium]